MGLQETLEAIAEPNRRKILELLKAKELSVSEIGEHLDITGASLSHHLNKLKSAGLVTSIALFAFPPPASSSILPLFRQSCSC